MPHHGFLCRSGIFVVCPQIRVPRLDAGCPAHSCSWNEWDLNWQLLTDNRQLIQRLSRRRYRLLNVLPGVRRAQKRRLEL